MPYFQIMYAHEMFQKYDTHFKQKKSKIVYCSTQSHRRIYVPCKFLMPLLPDLTPERLEPIFASRLPKSLFINGVRFIKGNSVMFNITSPCNGFGFDCVPCVRYEIFMILKYKNDGSP